MTALKISLSAILIMFGAFMVVYGEIDDNQGGQFLGLLSVFFG